MSKPYLSTTQLIIGVLALLAFDIGMDSYLDMKQGLEKHYSEVTR